MPELKHILHPTDFSNNSNQALVYACDIAEQFGAELHLLNILQDPGSNSPAIAGLDPTDYYPQLRKVAMEELDNLPGKLVDYKGAVTSDLCEGVPFVEIIRYAKKNAMDMIVMGTHGYSGLKHLLMGSVAENVVRKAPCPVLTVHPENFEFVMP